MKVPARPLSTYRHDNTYHILLGLCNVHVKENDKVCFDILFLRL